MSSIRSFTRATNSARTPQLISTASAFAWAGIGLRHRFQPRTGVLVGGCYQPSLGGASEGRNSTIDLAVVPKALRADCWELPEPVPCCFRAVRTALYRKCGTMCHLLRCKLLSLRLCADSTRTRFRHTSRSLGSARDFALRLRSGQALQAPARAYKSAQLALNRPSR